MKKLVLGTMLIALSSSFVGCGMEMVDTGYRGVKTHFGKVIEQSFEEGFYFYNPFSYDFIEMDVKTQRIDGEGVAYTRDVQVASLKYTAMVNPIKSSVHFLYRDYGWEWQEKILPQITSGAMKSVIGKWDAVDLIANREKARMEIEQLLKESTKDKYIEIVKFEITNIDYADEFEHAVERKVVAVQAAIEAQNKTVQITEEAKQRVISAKAEAESMRIRADALSQNKNLVEYEAVQKWDGKMPQYMMGGTTPFINIK